jgi:hypothetical protein
MKAISLPLHGGRRGESCVLTVCLMLALSLVAERANRTIDFEAMRRKQNGLIRGDKVRKC